jgi:hypothetical protein
MLNLFSKIKLEWKPQQKQSLKCFLLLYRRIEHSARFHNIPCKWVQVFSEYCARATASTVLHFGRSFSGHGHKGDSSAYFSGLEFWCNVWCGYAEMSLKDSRSTYSWRKAFEERIAAAHDRWNIATADLAIVKLGNEPCQQLASWVALCNWTPSWSCRKSFSTV